MARRPAPKPAAGLDYSGMTRGQRLEQARTAMRPKMSQTAAALAAADLLPKQFHIPMSREIVRKLEADQVGRGNPAYGGEGVNVAWIAALAKVYGVDPKWIDPELSLTAREARAFAELVTSLIYYSSPSAA